MPRVFDGRLSPDQPNPETHMTTQPTEPQPDPNTSPDDDIHWVPWELRAQGIPAGTPITDIETAGSYL